MKKEIMRMVAGVAGMAALAVGTAVMAEASEPVNKQGIIFQVPDQIKDLVSVQTEGLDADTIVSVYENASVDAAKTLGEDNDGAGWIFSITKVPEDKMKELRCGGMDGMEVFAEDDDIYYVYSHPTDVRMVRVNQEDYEADLEQYTKICEWAFQEVRQEVLANNPELDEEFYTNTSLDMHLAQAAYQPGTKYELRSLDFGGEAFDSNAILDNDYIEDLAEEATYEVLPDAQAPDGEYIVLAFDDDGEEVRYDFFKAEGSGNIIRETREVGGEEYVTLYQANFKSFDDAGKSATDIVENWCKAIAGESYDDDYDDDNDDGFYEDYDDDFDDEDFDD